MARTSHWLGYVAWTLGGTLTALSAVAFVPGLIFVLPFAATATIVADRHLWHRGDALGLASGIGIALVCLSIVYEGTLTCPGTSLVTCEEGPCRTRCADVALLPWIVIGVSLALAGFAAFMFARRSTKGHVGRR